MENIILVGGGGHCSVVLDALLLKKQFKIKGITDKKVKAAVKVLGVPVLGDDSMLVGYFKKGIRNCFITVGSVGSPDLRKKLFIQAKKIGFNLPNIIHPSATVSRFVELGEGNYIGAGAIVNPGSKIGDCCIINTAAIIEHDCNIGDLVHIAPAVTLSGGVRIGAGSHIGTAASVKQCVSIGKNVIVGAGTVVIKNIQDNVVVCGNPCKKIRSNE